MGGGGGRKVRRGGGQMYITFLNNKHPKPLKQPDVLSGERYVPHPQTQPLNFIFFIFIIMWQNPTAFMTGMRQSTSFHCLWFTHWTNEQNALVAQAGQYNKMLVETMHNDVMVCQMANAPDKVITNQPKTKKQKSQLQPMLLYCTIKNVSESQHSNNSNTTAFTKTCTWTHSLSLTHTHARMNACAHTHTEETDKQRTQVLVKTAGWKCQCIYM